MNGKKRAKLLLHVCCAPCTTATVERLRDEYDVTAFFYNPNIFPKEEYDRRLAETTRFCEAIGLPLEIGAYDPDTWLARTRGLQDEPEGGRRCRVCFGLRLRVAASYARGNGFDALATTLTISPHKDAATINELGELIGAEAGIEFLARDFKKRDGFRRSVELSHQHGLYRQDYCGCAASIKGPVLRF